MTKDDMKDFKLTFLDKVIVAIVYVPIQIVFHIWWWRDKRAIKKGWAKS